MQMDKKHQKFMNMAIDLSLENVAINHGTPFGSVIVLNGKIIAKSANRVHATNDPTAHAEVAAIRLACKKLKTFDLSGAVIYTSCEPCPMCLAAIYWSNISTVYYANTKEDAARANFDDQFIYDEFAKPVEDRKIAFEQLLRDEAQGAFGLWQEQEVKP
ncbi:MAG: nucleoside deaminase [Chitinophagaceae bacterium]|nr:MAG: nucleoside deaminase [Chitinophagaceae bacterium]